MHVSLWGGGLFGGGEGNEEREWGVFSTGLLLVLFRCK